MRKNSIRKLIHGILDLLPLFVIPIFAININQKSVEPISIEVQEEIVVDFNQKYNMDKPDKTQGSVSFTFNNNELTLAGTSTSTSYMYGSVEIGHTYICTFSYSETNSYVDFYCGGTYLYANNTNGITQKKYTAQFTVANLNVRVGFSSEYYQVYVNTYDLTQMNLENITIEEFNNMFPIENYQYTESKKMLVDKPTPTTYDDTDIGSQFLYSLYISTDNYFNMNNVFNLNGVYSWFEMNIFGGSAPLSIYIVWNIIIYELVMDLLMLLYALFMFFIDACQKLIDKPLESIK